MAIKLKSGEVGAVDGSLPELMVNSESIQRILDVGAGATRVDLLFAATRELTTLLGERGVCILLEGTPRIAVAPSDPMAEGRSVELGEHAEIAEALRVRDLVVAEDGSSIAVPLCGGGCCLGVVLVQSNHPRPGVCLDLATARLVARLTAALLRGAVELEGAILAPMALSPRRRRLHSQTAGRQSDLHGCFRERRIEPRAMATRDISRIGHWPLRLLTMHNTIARLRIGGINERDREGLAMTSESEQVVGPQHVDSAVGTGRWTPRPGPAKGRVLVIEDDSLVRDAMEPLLEDEGYEVWSAEIGQEALRWLQTDSLPDIIVLDLKMPVMDGWQFRVIQKGDAKLSRIPVLALSADRSAQATSISAQAFLRKPVDATTLLPVLSKPFKIDRAKQLMATGMRERSNG